MVCSKSVMASTVDRVVQCGRCSLHPEVYCSGVKNSRGYYCFKCTSDRIRSAQRFQVSSQIKVDGIFERRRQELGKLHERIKGKRAVILAHVEEIQRKRKALMGKLGCFVDSLVEQSEHESSDTASKTSYSPSCKTSSEGLYIIDDDFSYEQYLALIVGGARSL